MAILGLASTDTVSAQRWTNIRRKVFYQYPNGSAPLIGILSMMKEESTNDTEFSWWEKRLLEQVDATAYISTTVILAKTVTFTAGPTPDNTITVFTAATTPSLAITAGTAMGVCVADTSLFRVGHVIQIPGLTCVSGTNTLKGIIMAIDRSNKYLVVNPIVTFASPVVFDSTANLALPVQVIGSSFAQGITNQTTECYYLPISLGNYTQIFRTPFSFTGNALVTPVKFDDTGVYKDKAKSHSIDHMVEMELAFIFGSKYRNTVNAANTATPAPGVPPTASSNTITWSGLPQYTTGGIIYFLQQWEAGNSSSSSPGVGTAGAATLGYGGSAVTLDTQDNKRIIANSAGTMNEATYDGYMERLFRTSNNVSNEKLCLCGSGFLKVMNQMYRSQSVFVYYPPSGDTYGMEIVAHKTPFGTVYYKTHPLFSRNSTLRNNALFLDVHNLRYRPMDKRDTQLLKNRQPNDADYRMDEWFSEAGLELRMPESFMYIQNVQSYVP